MDYWLHRIRHGEDLSYQLLDQGYLTIGFSDFSEIDFLKNTIAGCGEYFDSQFEKTWDGWVPPLRYNLWRFLAEMKKGDLVVVPKSEGLFSICKLISPEPILIRDLPLKGELSTWVKIKNNRLFAKWEDDGNFEKVDLGFAWKVEPITGDISRSEYADAELTAKMKYRGATLCISNSEESIKRSIDSASRNKPISLKSEMANNRATREKWLKTIKKILTPDKFEKLIKDYFKKLGAEVEILPKNNRGKGDVDIMATFENIKTIIHVQAKLHTGTTNDFAVQQLRDFADSNSFDTEYQYQLWVISTADSFTKECKQLAEKNRILLVNGTQFADLLSRYAERNDFPNL